jgi:hypothetical protein
VRLERKPLATIKLLIDAESFERESGEALTDEMLVWLGQCIQEDAYPVCGYAGWEVGWVTCPAK